jgi:hypothetical protein
MAITYNWKPAHQVKLFTSNIAEHIRTQATAKETKPFKQFIYISKVCRIPYLGFAIT